MFARRLLRMTRCRKPVAWLGIAMYAALACGLSVPLPYAKNLARPYPCMHGNCGCRTAEQCWNACCCFSDQQKVAWSAANGVTPPADVVARAAAAAPRAACCETKAVVKAEKSACCEVVKTCCSPTGASEKTVQPRSDGSVALVAALRCQGAGDSWQGLAAGVMPPVLDWTLERPVAPLVELRHSLTAPHSLAPPVPPPQSLSV